MRNKCIIIFILISNTVYSQYLFEDYKQEISLFSGYNSTVGYIGAKYGYSPPSLKHKFQINGGLGFNLVQSALISVGGNYLLKKNSRIEPYIGFDFMNAFENSLVSDDGNQEDYKIGNHVFFNPFMAMRIRSNNRQLNFKIKVGYSFLLNNLSVEPLNNSTNIHQKNLENRVNGGVMIMIGVSSFY